ncbi:MAG: ABC transporter ATP-binding protein [Desulfurococcales archaeon]|nr:ABC transporter ATP-binding protein [Desulfurococcales archaeon]
MFEIVFEGVWKRYGLWYALRDVSFSFTGPGLLLVYGPNGSGKTTLAKIILGLARPSRGRVIVGGVDPATQPRRVQGMIANLLEGVAVPSWLTGRELARYYARTRGVPWSLVVEEAETLGVTGYWGRVIAGYSMGMRKKLLLALALAGSREAEALLLDEPYTFLDAASRERVAERIRSVSREKTVVVATHLITGAEEEAREALVLDNGRLVARLRRSESGVVACPRERAWETEAEYCLPRRGEAVCYRPRRVPAGCRPVLDPEALLRAHTEVYGRE